MATNLLSLLANEFRGDVVNRIAGALGENTTKTEAALGGALPALLGGLVTRASSNEGAASLIDLLKRNNFDSARYANPASAVSGPGDISNLASLGAPLLEGLFGTRTNSVTDWLASSSGISKSSSSSLMSMALPFVLGLIGRQLGSSGWSASGLMSLLSEQKGFLQQAAPAGLAGLLGLGGAATTDYTADRVAAEPTRRVYADEPDRRGGGGGWWKWAIPLLALLALIPLYRYFSSSGERPVATNVATTTPTVRATVTATPAATGTVGVTTASPATTVAPATAGLGAFTKRKLPNGTELNAPANGVESKLIGFIEDPGRAVDKETWFSFDRLEFETDSAKLRPSSEAQLRDVAEILKAYPQVNLKIGGYTDNVGNDAYNLKLSQDRANSTMNEIVKHGIASGRLAAEGYGKQFPVADNATAEGRQRNRRIDVRVTKK